MSYPEIAQRIAVLVDFQNVMLVGALQDRKTRLPHCLFLTEDEWRSVCKDWSGRA